MPLQETFAVNFMGMCWSMKAFSGDLVWSLKGHLGDIAHNAPQARHFHEAAIYPDLATHFAVRHGDHKHSEQR